MRIALVKAPATYANWYKTPVLGLASIASCLSKHGITTRIFDAYFHSWSRDQLVDALVEYRPDAVGFTAMTHEIAAAAGIARAFRQRHPAVTVLGGCHMTAMPERAMREFPEFDYGVFGEGEYTSLELFRALGRGSAGDLPQIAGLAYRQNGDIVVNAARAFLTGGELDSFAPPDYAGYYGDDRSALSGKDAFYIMMATRGCPYSCVFCMQVLGRTVRRRSVESVLDEIGMAVERYGAHTIDFADEIFLMDHPSTRAILDGLIKRGYARRIRWSALTRANIVTPDLIRHARRAGCYRLSMGVESGDDGILKNINKRITVQQIREAARIIKAEQIRLYAYYILGHPGETRETVKKTIRLAAELKTNGIAVGTMVPYPGTKVHEMAARGEHGYRLVSEDWERYDKYGGTALAIEGLPYADLIRYQRAAYLRYYLANFKLVEMLRFVWQRRRALRFFLQKRVGRRARA